MKRENEGRKRALSGMDRGMGARRRACLGVAWQGRKRLSGIRTMGGGLWFGEVDPLTTTTAATMTKGGRAGPFAMLGREQAERTLW